jgi:hypothetical protein
MRLKKIKKQHELMLTCRIIEPDHLIENTKYEKTTKSKF